jgi:LSD1 subclass zinc finger protein
MSADDARALDALCADLARPPPAWKRVAVVVGYAIGIVTLVVLAIGAIVGAIAGLVGAAKADAGETISAIIIVVCVAACGLVSVPLVGEFLVLAAHHRDFEQASQLALGGTTQIEIDLWVGAALYFFSVVPIALARTTQEKIKGLDGLRTQLAAAPALSGGAEGCRSCGAPLIVAPGAVAARCLYCQTESLVNVSGRLAARQKTKASELHGGVKQALEQRATTRAEDRKNMWAMLLAGPLLAPVVALGGVLLHAIASS